MAKLSSYKGNVKLMAGITQNGGDYPLCEANAVQVDEKGTRLDKALEDLQARSSGSLWRKVKITVSEDIELTLLPGVIYEIDNTNYKKVTINIGEASDEYEKAWCFYIQNYGGSIVMNPTVQWAGEVSPNYPSGYTTEVHLYYRGNTLRGVWEV